MSVDKLGKGLAEYILIAAILLAIFGAAQIALTNVAFVEGESTVALVANAVIAFFNMAPVATGAVLVRVLMGYLYRWFETGESFDVSKASMAWFRMVPTIMIFVTTIEAFIPMYPNAKLLSVSIVFIVDTVGIAFKHMLSSINEI